MKKQFVIILFFLMLIHVSADDGFIKTQGVQFLLNGSPFYANGFNAYWLMFLASDKSQRQKVSSTFQEATNHGLVVARTWAFSDGGDSPLQYSPGSYNEMMFQGLDFVVSEARYYGIKLILSLVNNFKEFGGKKQYVEWAKSNGVQKLTSEDDFFTNDVVKGYYKNHIKAILTRRNSITGVTYKDDPTIMAWELMNEPRCNTDLSGKTIQAWILEMSSYLKSIDSNHLLEIGLEGFYEKSDSNGQQDNPNIQVGTDFIENNQVAGIDFATAHAYPDQWLFNQSADAQLSFSRKWLSSHIEDAQNVLHKPLLFAEFGKSCKLPDSSLQQRDVMYDTVYSAIYSSASGGGTAAGGLFWQLLTEGMDSYRDGYEIIFSESPSTTSIITQAAQKINNIRKMYTRLSDSARWKSSRGKNGENNKNH